LEEEDPMPESFAYDVFLSHSSKDKPAVRELAERLRDDGLRVWFDDWEIKPGHLIPKKVEDGLQSSRTLILVMSANAFESDWVTLERHTALYRDPTNADRRFIPLRLDDAKIKDMLKQFAFVDWRQKSDKEYEKLLMTCRPAPEETTVPTPPKGESLGSKVLKGRTNYAVVSVAVTGDGRLICGCDDHTVRVWDLDAGRCIATLKGHTAPVNGVAVTADGRRAVSSSQDTTLRVWDLDAGRCIAILEGHTASVYEVGVTEDGRRAVSASSDFTVRVWDLDAGECIATLKGHTAPVNGVAVTADGRRAVSGSQDMTLRVWDLDARRCIATLKGSNHWVNGVALTKDGRRAVCGNGDSTIRVWDLDAGRCLATLEGHTRAATGVALASSGLAISGSVDRTLRVWDLDAGRCLAVLQGHSERVYCVVVTPDGRHAVSGSNDKTLHVWDLPPYFHKPGPDPKATRYTKESMQAVGAW
jgi:tricorn protease-like protein